ncbi:alkaline phosphatase family protein [Pseudarthrobacter sp. efr-133-R2A-89]|uniref:alkaline phosphatase family protein n=1 Tax=Pseudarthrobacter sp. efr-133-R2A-89 TaxID=3040302 RepID=UPI0025531047|nr:alkaline phosphatase family protein [Pseudarthrobacter sp. efr-133-R2A-89]
MFSRGEIVEGRNRRRRLVLLFVAILFAGISLSGCQAGPGTPPANSGTPGHVFVINLENQGYDKVFGSTAAMPYLAGTLRSQGVLLTNYYGVAHDSLPDYLAQISGQPPNASTVKDCPTFTPFTPSGTDSQGRLLGAGCVYPPDVPTVAGQLTGAGKTWKGYMEDMQSPCLHPALGAPDDHRTATRADQYSTHHNPFVYFRSITDSPDCTTNVVNYTALATDLLTVNTTPNLSYITPNLCHDAHDSPCADGNPGGLGAADAWLKTAVPAILDSPAFKQDGMLVITLDEADHGRMGPPNGVPGGTAGGQVGALVLSPFSPQGGTSSQPYNHYSLLATMEDFFSVPRLAGAAETGVMAFGADVYKSHA